MVPRVQLLQPLARDVGVDRRRRDVGVAEQHLHGAQVGAVVEQVVANAWRTVCGESGTAMPALRACAFSSFQNI
jgi:hypothetical protein